MIRFLRFVCLLVAVSAYSTPKPSSSSTSLGVSKHTKAAAPPPATKFAPKAMAAAMALSALLSMTEPALASSKTAAQISLNSLPPSTISVQIGDLPVVGNLISGTYTKIPDGSIKGKPSIVIKSPTDKVSAVKSIVTGGHIEFDVDGLVNTHMDVDIGADEAGVAKVRVASNLIPPLPFKNAATQASKPSGKATPWSAVTNMGTGKSYYYNEDTGVSQNDRPTI
jgi:hypothetical protein